MNTEQIKYLEKRLEQIEERFEEIDTLNGFSLVTESKLQHLLIDINKFKEDFEKLKHEYKIELTSLKKDISFGSDKGDHKKLKEEIDKELDKIDDIFKDPSSGIYTQLRDLNRITTNLEKINKALELKFDTRIDTMSPDLRDVKNFKNDILEICGKRLEKLDSLIKKNEKHSQYYDKIVTAAISAGFALAVAFLKDCHF